MYQAITASKLITPTSVVSTPLILLREGKIDRITTRAEEAAPGSTLDLGEATLTPAFLDVHVHGAAGSDLMMGTAEAFTTVSRYLGKRGVGEYLATTVTAPVDHTLRSLECIANYIEQGGDAHAAT